MNEDSKHNRRAVERLLGKTQPESDGDLVREPFEEARPRSREDIMLDVRLKDGSREAFSYAYLVRAQYRPGDEIRLHFGSECVSIAGRALGALFERLIEHRARFVQEGNDAEEALRGKGEPHIEAIRIEPIEPTKD